MMPAGNLTFGGFVASDPRARPQLQSSLRVEFSLNPSLVGPNPNLYVPDWVVCGGQTLPA